MNWIRVGITIMDDSDIDTMASACGVRIAEMVGCVVGVLVHLPAEAKDGNITEKSDRLLEKWACWQGKKGRFAAAFRQHLCREDGVVRSWEKYNGAALRESDRTRERAKEWRDKKIANPVPNGDRTPYATRTESVDETRRDELLTNKADGEAVVTPPSAIVDRIFRGIAPCVGPAGHDALLALLATVQEPETWAGVIRGCSSGQSMPEARPASAERLASAVQDFVAAGHHRTRPAKVKLFRGFVSSAKASTPASRQWLNVDEDKADELRTIREQNERRRKRNEPPKPLPTWAAEIDAKFPDGRTWPGGVAA